jgi:Protein of unknown function (DUF3072)
MRHDENTREIKERSQSSREKMTGAQASHLKTLAEEVREPSAFAENLSKREASRRIDALAERVRLSHLPPHTD